MAEKAELKEKLQRPSQLQVNNGRIESYPTLEAAVMGWRRLSLEDKARAVIWCDGELFELGDIEELDAAV